MKKIYFKPTIKVIHLAHQAQLLSGSTMGPGASNSEAGSRGYDDWDDE